MRDQVDGAMLESWHFKMFFMKALYLEHNYVKKNCEIIGKISTMTVRWLSYIKHSTTLY